MNRTLATCSEIFKEVSCPIVAEPLLAEGLRSACDFGCELEVKKKNYPQIDFSKVEKVGQYWYIENDSEDNRAEYYNILKNEEGKSYIERLSAIFEYMKKTQIFETPTNLRRRI